MPPVKATSYQAVNLTEVPTTTFLPAPDFRHLEMLNQADDHVNKRRRHLSLTIGLIVLVIVVFAVAGATAWYFTRSSYLENVEVLGSVRINIHTLTGNIFSKSANGEESQLLKFGDTGSSVGPLTFLRYCTVDSMSRSAVVKDPRYRYLCLLYTSAAAAAAPPPEYRLLIQVNQMDAQEDFECYDVQWDLPSQHGLMDCFSLEHGAHVYGGGQRPLQRWPSDYQPLPTQVMASDPQSPDGFLSIAIPYWLLTSGVSVMADSKFMFSVTLNSSSSESSDKQPGFCIGTMPKEVKPLSRDATTHTFSYAVCVGTNMTHTHQKSLKKYQDATAPPIDENLIQNPIWNTLALGVDQLHNLDQSAVLSLADILEDARLPVSQILIDPRWESQPGEDVFDKKFFANPKALFDSLRLRKISPQLMSHPFLSFKTSVFHDLNSDPVMKKFLAKEDGRDQSPANVSSWMGSAAMLDLSQMEAVKWKADRVKNLFDQYQLHGCRFLGGSSGWLSANNNRTSSKYLRTIHAKFSDGAANICGQDVSVEVTARFSRRTIRIADEQLVTATDAPLSRIGIEEKLKIILKSVIPSALTVSFLGHPIFVSAMIGGNPFVDANGQLDLQNAESKYPSQELYLRWLGVALFFPILEFALPPTIFSENDQHLDIVEMTKTLLAIRKTNSDYLIRAAKASAQSGFPMVRPLWWHFPTDKATWVCDDQYFIGDDLMVAPLVTVDTNTRKIYLPTGTWKDTRGRTETGPKWLTVTAHLDEVPYFFRNCL